MRNVFSIALNCRTRSVPNDAIERAMSGLDWLRYSADNYLLSTHLTADRVFELIKPTLHPEDNIIILRADLGHYRGWASQLVVNYLTRLQAEQTGPNGS